MIETFNVIVFPLRFDRQVLTLGSTYFRSTTMAPSLLNTSWNLLNSEICLVAFEFPPSNSKKSLLRSRTRTTTQFTEWHWTRPCC